MTRFRDPSSRCRDLPAAGLLSQPESQAQRPGDTR